jgi:hypothetical protein
MKVVTNGDSTVVEHLPHHPKVEGLIPATAIGTGRQKMAKSHIKYTMEQRALQNVHKCLNTIIYSYLETYGGQSSNLYLKVVHFFLHQC